MKDFNWSDALKECLKENGDELQNLVVQTPCNPYDEPQETKPRYADIDDAEFAAPFDPGYGGENGCWFTAWGKRWIYFPASYDGAEWIAKVPRSVCLYATMHI